MSNFIKSNNELKNRLEESDNKMTDLCYKYSLLKSDNFYNKLRKNIFFTVLCYLPISLLTYSLTIKYPNSLGNLISNLPVFTVPTVLLGLSTCIINIIDNYKDKKLKTKEEIAAFSNSKTNKEKREEEIKYMIELSKEAFKYAILQRESNTINMNSSYQISPKDFALSEKFLQDEKEYKSDVENSKKLLLTELTNDYDKLSILAIQKELNTNFSKVRSKLNKITHIPIISLVSGLIFMFIMELPLMMLKNIVCFNITSNLIFYMPFMFGTFITCGLVAKKDIEEFKLFNKINDSLGEEKLPKYIDNPKKEIDNIRCNTSSLAREIVSKELLINDLDMILDSLPSDEEVVEEIKVLDNIEPIMVNNFEYLDDDLVDNYEEESEIPKQYIKDNKQKK